MAYSTSYSASQLASLVGKHFKLEVIPATGADRTRCRCFIPVVVKSTYVDDAHFYITCSPQDGVGELIVDNPELLTMENDQPWKG